MYLESPVHDNLELTGFGMDRDKREDRMVGVDQEELAAAGWSNWQECFRHISDDRRPMPRWPSLSPLRSTVYTIFVLCSWKLFMFNSGPGEMCIICVNPTLLAIMLHLTPGGNCIHQLGI